MLDATTVLYLTIAGLAVTVLLIIYGSWASWRPHNSLEPRIIPWRIVLLLLGVVAIVLIMNLASELGYRAPMNGAFSP